MSPIGQVGEVRICAQPVEDCLKFMRGAVEVEGVGGAYDEVDSAFEVGFELGPVGFDDVGEIVVIVPVGDDGWVYGASGAVEHLLWGAGVVFGGEDPLEGGQLSTVGAQDLFEHG